MGNVKKQKENDTEPVKIRLSTAVKNKLQKLADENERTLAGQIRLALNEWIENKIKRGAQIMRNAPVQQTTAAAQNNRLTLWS